jgi:putative transposase
VWAEQIAAAGAPVTVANETAFLVDFLPVIRRTLSRTGYQIDHVQYYRDALKPWIARRERLGKFVLRRDPRDISRIWALDPGGDTYVQVPYRTLSRPPISVWKQQAAVARLRELGRAEVDEQALFTMVERMRERSPTLPRPPPAKLAATANAVRRHPPVPRPRRWHRPRQPPTRWPCRSR